MRAVICLLTAAITFGACGGEAPRITGFRLGPDGRPDMSTAREVESVQQAVIDGLAYWRDCRFEPVSTLYGKEAKVCGDGGCSVWNNVPSSCVAFGAGGYDLMFLSMDSLAWPSGAYSGIYGWIGGASMNTYRPYSMAVKAADYPFPPTTHSNFEFYKNTQFGDCTTVNGQQTTFSGCMAGLGNGVVRLGIFVTPMFDQVGLPGSLEFNRWCGDNGNPGGGVPC
jgi:hypothetical protein